MVKAAAIAIALVGGVVPPAAAPAPGAQPAAPQTPWPSHEMPLPIAVKNPQDLAFKTEVERQYLIFNLMATGRMAYETGDYGRAAREWEALLKVPGLPPEIARAVSPLLAEAQRLRGSAGGPNAPAPDQAPAAAVPAPPPGAGPAAAPEEPRGATVTGSVSGGGAVGPGGAVLWLKRLDGPTPSPKIFRKPRLVNQVGKTFVPHVLAIPAGQAVVFRNDDPYFHNVFSLSPGEGFDAGLYDSGKSYTRTFKEPGVIELLCNIHASMSAYIYVVDTAYYAQPRPSGNFLIKNVVPGRYELSVWHESSALIVKRNLTVGPEGVNGIVVRIPGDRAPLVVVPDKYGKPRQPQLGY